MSTAEASAAFLPEELMDGSAITGATGAVMVHLDKLLPGRAFDVGMIIRIGEMIAEILERCRESESVESVVAAGKRTGLRRRVAIGRGVRRGFSLSERRAFGAELRHAMNAAAVDIDGDAATRLVMEVAP